MSWRERIVELVLVKQELSEVDVQRLWEYKLPGLAATASELAKVEAVIGEKLDPQYRAFLSYAGGWPAFFQTVDLFGPADLVGGSRMASAKRGLANIEPTVLEASGFARGEVLPIAASAVDLDLFVMGRRGTPLQGTVVWLAGYEVDRFPTFTEFFDTMVDYNRAEIGHAREASSKEGRQRNRRE